MGADVNKKVDNTMALVEAARDGHKHVVSLLLDRDVDVDMKTYTTALIAAATGGHKHVVMLLLESELD